MLSISVTLDFVQHRLSAGRTVATQSRYANARSALERYLETSCGPTLDADEAILLNLEREFETGSAICRVASSRHLWSALPGFLVPTYLGERIGVARDRIRFASRVLDQAPHGNDMRDGMRMFTEFLDAERRAQAYVVFLSNRATEPWERAVAATRTRYS
jgi:hypothetical protein